MFRAAPAPLLLLDQAAAVRLVCLCYFYCSVAKDHCLHTQLLLHVVRALGIVVCMTEGCMHELSTLAGLGRSVSDCHVVVTHHVHVRLWGCTAM